jgi:putative transposase
MRIIAYCLMPNHWHLLLWPERAGELSRFLHRVTGMHASRRRRETSTTGQGAVYQSRFHAVGVGDTKHLFVVWRYIERNPLEAALVSRAEDWPWSSAAQAAGRSSELRLDDGPVARPAEWLTVVNRDHDWSEPF